MNTDWWDKAKLPNPTLRVGVTGHRADRLDDGTERVVTQATEAVLEQLTAAARRVATPNSDVYRGTSPDLRLISSLADGADTLVSERGIEFGLRIDAILPFPIENYTADFDEAGKKRFANLANSPLLGSLLVLEGTDVTRDQTKRDLGFLAAGRAVLDHSDLVLTIWDGEGPRGTGGTGQIVHEAIERGLPVIWIDLKGQIWTSESSTDLSQHLEVGWKSAESEGGNLASVLEEWVKATLAPPVNPVVRRRLSEFLTESPREESRWCGYDLLRRTFVGRKFSSKVRYRDPDGEASWERYTAAVDASLGKEFGAAIRDKLAPRARAADLVAVHYSHAYRTAYVTSFGLAATATLTGLLGLFFANGENALLIKAAFVLAEVVMIMVLVRLINHGRRNDWHRRWMEYRQLAEFLRSSRLSILTSGSLGALRDVGASEDDAGWISWYVRATLRELGPPSGRMPPMQKAMRRRPCIWPRLVRPCATGSIPLHAPTSSRSSCVALQETDVIRTAGAATSDCAKSRATRSWSRYSGRGRCWNRLRRSAGKPPSSFSATSPARCRKARAEKTFRSKRRWAISLATLSGDAFLRGAVQDMNKLMERALLWLARARGGDARQGADGIPPCNDSASAPR